MLHHLTVGHDGYFSFLDAGTLSRQTHCEPHERTNPMTEKNRDMLCHFYTTAPEAYDYCAPVEANTARAA